MVKGFVPEFQTNEFALKLVTRVLTVWGRTEDVFAFDVNFYCANVSDGPNWPLTHSIVTKAAVSFYRGPKQQKTCVEIVVK